MDVCEKIRKLLSNAKLKDRKNESSIELSSLIANENGIIHLLNAVFDFDETSQINSSHIQRLIAISTIVGKMPKLAFSEETYFSGLSVQLLTHLKIDEKSKPISEKLWRAAALICIALNERNMKLTNLYILDPIINTLKKNNDCVLLTIADCVIIINRLVLSRYSIEQLLATFPYLFYFRVNLQKSQTHLKSALEETLKEMLLSNIRTVYLLDNTLFHKSYLLDLYDISDFDAIESKHKNCNDDTFGLDKIDDITQTCCLLLQNFDNDFIVEFFLILVDRMSYSSQPHSQLLLYSIMDTLQSAVLNLLLKNTSKAIQFIVSNLERIVNQLNRENFDFHSPCVEQQNETLKEARLSSLSMTLLMIKQLLHCNNEITENDKALLNQCSANVDKILSLCETNEEIVRVSVELKQKISHFSEKFSTISSVKSNLEEAISDLNDSAIHIRTHGLIMLRRLIISRNNEVMKQKQRLLIMIQASLSDEESYVYLAAIRTLAAFALNSTDDVLPLLMDSFRDKQRTCQERVNVGEVLINLIKGLGELAHCYGKLFVNEFLRGLKDEEPVIRISSLSNLGQICSEMRFSVSLYIIEIFEAVKCLLETDPILDVKRAAIMFIHLMLNGIDKSCIQAIESEICNIYKLVKRVSNSCLDEVLQVHCQLAIHQFDRLANQLINTNSEPVKRIQLIN